MDKPQKTLADFVAIAVSPLLIMVLVGSLVFFLLEVIYVGRYAGSLQYILFFFVFGAVLVARISMQAGISDRATLYGLVLALVAWLALLRFVDYPEGSPLAPWGWAINLGLIAIIWWSAHRLTWDCTLIDDDVDASGSGLLESAGFEQSKEDRGSAPVPDARPAKKRKETGGLIGWMQRYDRYREERRKKPHTPGVWVVYFSLAALPLFGLGQSQIPPTEAARRHYTFQLMCVYVGSGLGLLLTTSFLGLRRYLRQRNLRMPAAITSAWLGLGGLLIVAMLVLGAIVPRPADPNPLLDWLGVGSKDRDASRFAQVGEGKEKQKDENASRTEADERQEKGEAGGKGKKGGKGNKSGKQNKASEKGQKDSKQAKEGAQDKDESRKESAEGQQQEKDSEEKKGSEKKEESQQKSSGKRSPNEDSDRPRQAKGGTPPRPPAAFMSQLAALLKWLVIALIILLVALFILRAGLNFLANFTNWARRLLAGLQAWWQGLGALFQRRRRGDDEMAVPMPTAPPRPFSAYPDPFATGRAGGMSPGELVRYSFEALEAWAREQDLERKDQETPLEFTQRLGDEVPTLEEEACRLAGFYGSLAYARGRLPESCREGVRKFWRSLEGRARRPMSAARG